MKTRKSPRQFHAAGTTFLIIGLAELLIGLTRAHPFVAVGIVFLAIGAAFHARARRMSGA